MLLAFVCAGLFGAFPSGDETRPADLKANYEAARAGAGRSSEGQVKLALWCEAHGMDTLRVRHLALAILADPSNATARGLMGLVSYDGRWLRPEALAEKLGNDPDHARALAEYQDKRLRAPYTADAQLALGLWADEHGLKEQAKAHLTAVIRLDPKREIAWKRLGFKHHDGRWVTDAHVAAEKADAEAQKAADRKWKVAFEKFRSMLDQPSHRDEAEAALAGVTDPRAVPMIGQVFARSGSTQLRAVQLLGQIDSAGSSKALAYLSIFGRTPEARRIAVETLRGRDAREYADLLIALIQEPIKFEVKPVGGPGSAGEIFVEGKKANVRRLYSAPTPFKAGDVVKIDPATGLALVERITVNADLRPNISGDAHYYLTEAMVGDENSYTNYRLPSNQAFASYFGLSTSHSPAAQQGTASHHSLPPSLPHAGSGPDQYMAAIKALVTSPASGYDPTPSAFDYASSHADLNRRGAGLQYQAASQFSLEQMQSEARRAGMMAKERLSEDVGTLERYNDSLRINNERVVNVLNEATDQKLGLDRKDWMRWWVDQLGYAFVTDQTPDKPTIVEVVPIDFEPQVNPIHEKYVALKYVRLSCFAAGTPVQTADGLRPIETLRPGDLVLTQDVSRFALGYKPILKVHHNPPSPTFRVVIDGESVVASPFHRFWVAGQGWVMARNLKVGDPIRTLAGVKPVEVMQADQSQLVYNLDVADDADFFVGKLGALVHDNSLPDLRLVPLDAPR